MRSLFAGVGLLALIPSCQVEEPVGASEAPIINGSADTSTKAVAWLFDENQGSACTGTIIHIDGDTGYVLTAAHCTNMDYVVVANDFQDCLGGGNSGCEAVFAVSDQIYHPSYDNNDPGQGYDFSLIRFGGATGFPHFIPAAQSPDGLSEGSVVDIVGYGQTESGDNSLRKHKQTQVLNLYGQVLVEHYSTVCFGDSGGPAIMNGTVVGVSSFIAGSCNEYGYSARVGPIYASFIQPYIGTNPPTTSSGPTTTTATSSVGAGTGGSGEGASGEGAGSNVDEVDPDDDYEWYPGKQDGKDEDGDSSSCSASGGVADSSLALVALVGLAGGLARRRRTQPPRSPRS